MKVRPNKNADAGLVRRPHVDKTQDKKVKNRPVANSHKSDAENQAPNIIKQNSTFSCICGYHNSSPTRMRYHKNLCKQFKSSESMPPNKSLNINTEPSSSPHSLSDSICTTENSFKFSPYVNINQSNFNKYTPRPKLNLPKPSDNISWNTLNKELHETLNTSLPLSSLSITDIDTASNHFFGIVHWYLEQKCGVLEPKTKPQRKIDKDDKIKSMLRDLKKAIHKKWELAKRESNKENQKSARAQFRKVITALNKLRRDQNDTEKELIANTSRREFRNDPWKFCDANFAQFSSKGKSSNSTPSFDKDHADNFFSSTYKDIDRNKPYHTPPQLKVSPPPPSIVFNSAQPTLADIKNLVFKKPNNSCPGWDALPYLLYKKCPTLIRYVHFFFVQVWSQQIVPEAWRVAYIILLSKSADTSSADQFRPIALGNSMGKLFFTLVQQRITSYILENKYLDISIQKAFLPKLAGCVEHTQTLVDALQDAYRSNRCITAVFIDLKNAYGSVRHALILYALLRYHFPPFIIKLLISYYDLLVAQIVTPNFSSKWIHYAIGIFQGCTLSTILFNIAYNILSEWMSSDNTPGYNYKNRKTELKTLLFADDTTFISGRWRDAQQMLNHASAFFDWSVTMKARPNKCVCLAWARIEKGHSHQVEVLINNKNYAPIDPKLVLQGETIPCLFKQQFKFLGRKIGGQLSDPIQKQHLLDQCESMLAHANSLMLSGAMKLWIYNNYIVSVLCWQMMIYDPAKVLGTKLETIARPFLKLWSGLALSANDTMLYLPMSEKGLGLKNLSIVLKQLQVSKLHILKHSEDPKVRQLYANKKEKAEKLLRWNPIKELEELERTVELAKMTKHSQSGTQGLGSMNEREDSDPKKENRKEVLRACKNKYLHEKLVHLHSLAIQGQWLKWDEHMRSDRSWTQFLYYLPQELFEWANNAQLRTLPTPDNLRRWNKSSHSRCELCYTTNCTLLHILNCCSFSLHHNRYTWRHNGILRIFESIFIKYLNSLYINSNSNTITFVKAGQKQPSSSIAQNSGPKLIKYNSSILSLANDWKMCVDLPDHNYIFPAHIAQTDARPDIVLWSEMAKFCILIELTVPLEENTAGAQQRKLQKYLDLVDACKMSGYETKCYTVEVGSRGWIAPSVHSCLKILGIPSEVIKTTQSKLANAAMRMSYLIYVNRENKDWNPWEWKVDMVSN